ncbi:MAG TPA: hypothetical protein VIH91_00195 [Terriglobales bacterium]
MKRYLWPIYLLFLSLMVAPALTQTRDRDPLTDAEVDQMREAADYPNKRLELMVRFAKERVAMIGILRSDPASATRPKQIHDYLQDFITLLDETDDNIDMYASHHSDLRKGLKLLIEANSEWQLQLRQLKEQSPAEELQQYSFVLSNAVDTVADSAKNARETLEEQNKLAAEKKLNKDYSERKE